MFDKIKSFKNINVYVPLSCGDSDYADIIVKKGHELFKDNFYPIMNFMKHEEYIEFLSTIDVAIFNHKRQEGTGNIISLLGMGKKLFIRNDITTYAFLESLRIKTYSLMDNKEYLNQDELALSRNAKIIKKAFTVENLKDDLCRIFN